MNTKFKLMLMSFGVTMLVTIGLAVVSLYTYHQGASLRKNTAVGPTSTTLDAVATHNPGIAESTTLPVQQQPSAASAPQGSQLSQATEQHDNGKSPFDDATKVTNNMGPNNPALLRSLPAFLRNNL